MAVAQLWIVRHHRALKIMKGTTLAIIGLILILMSIVIPKMLGPDSPSIIVALTRPAGVICALIGLIRISRKKKP